MTGLVRIMTMLMAMTVAFVMVRVAQYRKFLKQKKSEQASQQGRKQGMNIGTRFKRFGQGMQ